MQRCTRRRTSRRSRSQQGVYRSSRTHAGRCNWKLAAEASSARLSPHRCTAIRSSLLPRVRRRSYAEAVGPHIPSADHGAARAPARAPACRRRGVCNDSAREYRFPSTDHHRAPKMLTSIDAMRQTPSHTTFEHVMLVPRRAGTRPSNHWAKSWSCRGDSVPARENFRVRADSSAASARTGIDRRAVVPARIR